ncbi:hypothetical protein NQ317_009817 [Molorchus minor]|uniref:Senescence domain-containing protein n=1 Tax=Molorchus minor TaxID=1323400 RepID=A0ABQ9JV23_9CUCU|nr:hypothetical protein NQ317_009817 [Molorchus minor]
MLPCDCVNFLAPHIQKQGTRVLTTGFKMSEQEATDKIKSIFTVTAGAVEGFSTVYNGLGTSASILANSLKQNTVKIVDHKYGQPASTFTGDTLTTVGNVYSISENTKFMTPMGLAKCAVRDKGKAMVYDHTFSSGASTSYGQLPQQPNSSRAVRKSTSGSSLDSKDKESKKDES